FRHLRTPPPPRPLPFPYTTLFRSVIPAKAGIHCPAGVTPDRWIPTSAGMTICGIEGHSMTVFHLLRHGHHGLLDPTNCHPGGGRDRKSTRLNSSHVKISYAVFCLK